MRRGSRKNRLLDWYVGVPLLNVAATLHRRRRWHGQWAGVRQVGVLCSPALGDTLLLAGPLMDLRRFLDRVSPGAEITHLVTPTNQHASDLLPGVDRRVGIDLTRPAAAVRAIRAEQFDILLDFSSWQRLTAFYTLSSGARFTAGFRTAGQHRSRGYDLAVEHRADRHEVDNFRALLEATGVKTGAEPELLLTGNAPPTPADLVVLHLWASGQRSWLREWPAERWVQLAERLAGPETVFWVTGAPSDRGRTEPFMAQMRAAGLRAEPFTGTDGFRTLAHVLRAARVVVSVNTGVMHLAALVGAPTVAINGPNRNGRWGPLGPRALGVEAPGAGCGFLHLGFNFDGEPEDCMGRISVEMAEEAVRTVTAPGVQTRYGLVVPTPELKLGSAPAWAEAAR